MPGDISFPQLTELKKYAFDNCTSLTSITSLGQITSIEDYCFRGCSGLSSITIPSTVTTIKSYGFADCTGVSSITIPSDVTSIGEKAFQNVTSIKIKAMTPPSINSDTFTSGKITSITVPVGTGAAYKAATNWSSFADIIVEGVI